MGVGVCTGDEGDTKMLRKVDELVVDDAPEFVECHLPCSLVPITPDVYREQGDFPLDANSPVTVVARKPAICDASDSNDHNTSSPQTPKHGVFDPFAPGLEDMVQAPMCRKYPKQLRTNVARRLLFGSSGRISEQRDSLAEFSSDQDIFQIICQNIWEVFVSNQIECDLAEIYCQECDAYVCTTPPDSLFSGIADTCPATPLKPDGKTRSMHLGTCKKLQF